MTNDMRFPVSSQIVFMLAWSLTPGQGEGEDDKQCLSLFYSSLSSDEAFCNQHALSCQGQREHFTRVVLQVTLNVQMWPWLRSHAGVCICPDGLALDPTQNACFSVSRHACHCFVLCFNLFFLTVWKRPFRVPFFKLKRGTYHFLPRLPMFCTMFQLLCLTKNARFLECKKGFVTMFVVGVL